MPADAPSSSTGLDRRSFLAAAGVAGLLGLPASAAAPTPALSPGPRVVRHGNVYLVDGWVLTAGDLRALGIAA
jgi:hypothetical protein